MNNELLCSSVAPMPGAVEHAAWWSVRKHLWLTLMALIVICAAVWIGAAQYATGTPVPEAIMRTPHLLTYLGR